MSPDRRRARFELRAFRADLGYDRGRSFPWQLAWVATSHLVVRTWWCPKSLRVRVLRAFGARIGERVEIRHDVRIHWPWKLTVGDDVWIGVGATILDLEPVVIGDNVCISQEVFVSTGSHDHRSHDFRFANAPVEVGEGSWLALRSVVLAGTRVPPRTVVGAGEIVGPTSFERAARGGSP